MWEVVLLEEFGFPSCCQTGSNSNGDFGWEKSCVIKTQLPAESVGTGKQTKASWAWGSRATQTLSKNKNKNKALQLSNKIGQTNSGP